MFYGVTAHSSVRNVENKVYSFDLWCLCFKLSIKADAKF